jgi:hypothetical protein
MAWLSVVLVPALRCLLSALKKTPNQSDRVIPSNRYKNNKMSICAPHTERLKLSITTRGMT